MLSHALEGDEHGYASVFFMVLTIRMLSEAFFIALFALLKPVFLFAGGSPKTFKRNFRILRIYETIGFTAAFIAMIIFVSNDDDEAFSIAIAVS
jgi:hypothetical protein